MDSKRKYKELSRNTLLFTISNFGSKFISFLLVPLYTYTLSTKDYGVVDLINTTIQLLGPCLSVNIQDAILRFSMDDEYDKREVIGVGIKVIFVSSCFLGFILAVIGKLEVLNISYIYLIFILLNYSLGILFTCLSMYIKAINKVKIITIASILNAIFTSSLNIVFLLWLKKGVIGYLIANIIGIVIAVIYSVYKLNIFKEVSLKSKKGLFGNMVIYSLPLVFNSLAWWINNASDRYILTYYCGTAIDGIYAVSYKIPMILSTIQYIFYSAWSVSAIKEFEKNDTDGFIGNIFTIYSNISILICSFLLVFNIIIAKCLYAKDFFEAWKYVSPLLVGTVFNGIVLFEGCIFTAVKKTNIVTITTVLGAIINTVLNFLLIPIIGAEGAAVATMLGYLAIYVVRTCQLQSIIKLKVDWTRHIIIIALLILQMILASFTETYLLQIPIVIIIVVLQRRYFKYIFNIFKYKVINKRTFI